MSTDIPRTSDVVPLPSVLDATTAHALKETLLEALSLRADVVIDGAGVERVGTPGVQVLVAAGRSLVAGPHRLVLAKPSRALCEAFADLGLAAELKLWSDA